MQFLLSERAQQTSLGRYKCVPSVVAMLLAVAQRINKLRELASAGVGPDGADDEAGGYYSDSTGSCLRNCGGVRKIRLQQRRPRKSYRLISQVWPR